MAKVYDPIMCMMVDKPDKAQDELKIKKEDGLWCVYKDGKVVGQSNSEAGALRLYRMFESKAQDAKTHDAASGDVMKQIVSTAKAWAKQYNQLFEKAATAEEVKKLKSQKDNDYRRAMDNLDKIYNEVSQEYGRARSEVRDLFDEVDSNGFKAYQRVTQK